MKTPEKMANPMVSFQKANASNPKVLRMVAPGTSMTNPNLSQESASDTSKGVVRSVRSIFP